MASIEGFLSNVRAKAPLVHFITNYVTVNDCANMTLACGGSPIMADEVNEASQITAIGAALVINIGTANERTLSAMLRAGRRANDCGIPVLLDPVGAGVSEFRKRAVSLLLREVNFTVIKGNASEIQYLSNGITSSSGVDACAKERVCEENLNEVMQFSRQLSVMTGSIIVITSPIDLVTNHESGYAIRNGHTL